ncbi:MAG: DinB family protein [Flavobacteriales bacterium]|nr:DinB family protein [Flavobacteriales bacterium]
MDRSHLIDQLACHEDVFRALFNGLSPAELTWKPAPDKWCALEVVCHLHDEEREDFRARLAHVLNTPHDAMPKIDPAAWVVERRYIDQDLDAVLAKFLYERSASLVWLRSLTDAPWNNFYLHPTAGPVSCDLLLTNWVAHDLHHMRQLINLRYAYLRANSNEPLDYAGTW